MRVERRLMMPHARHLALDELVQYHIYPNKSAEELSKDKLGPVKIFKYAGKNKIGTEDTGERMTLEIVANRQKTNESEQQPPLTKSRKGNYLTIHITQSEAMDLCRTTRRKHLYYSSITRELFSIIYR